MIDATGILQKAANLFTTRDEPPKAEPCIDEITHTFAEDIQKTFSAYFNTHSSAPTSLPEGLTIPWFSVEDSRWNKGTLTQGYIKTTGEVSPKGKHVVDVYELSNSPHFTFYTKAPLALTI
jgi:hypothetical protein|tara:strand:+ start:130944 stop:131306 length:363 start_codon:yes stop_codon:yes gene_type:complete